MLVGGLLGSLNLCKNRHAEDRRRRGIDGTGSERGEGVKRVMKVWKT